MAALIVRRLLLGFITILPAAVFFELGRHHGWWTEPIAVTLLIVASVVEGVALVLLMVKRLRRDERERIAAEDQLRQSEERFRQLFAEASDRLVLEAARREQAKLKGIVSIATDAIISVDEAQRITLYNEGAAQIFGWTPDEVLGKPLDILIPERFRERHRQHVIGFAQDRQRSRKMGERAPMILGVRKSGEEFRADAAISKVEVEGARHFTVVLRDATDHIRRLEEQSFLARVGEVLGSTLSYHETLDHVSELVVSVMGDMCTVDAVGDQGAMRRVKAAHADPAKASLMETAMRIGPSLSAPERQVVTTKQSQLLADIPPGFFRSLPQNQNDPDEIERGQLMEMVAPISLIAVPLTARGRLIGVLSIVSCRADRRYGPTELGLAHEVSRRFALALDNARLYELAQDAVEMRDRVLGVVAHDLRNPMNAVLLNIEQLRHRGTDPERRSQRHIDRISRAALRMNRLIQDLLDVIRLEAGHLVVERTHFSVRDLVVEAVETARQVAAQQSIELEIDVADTLPFLLADRDRLFQTLDNLIGNAIKFTPRGGHVIVSIVQRQGEIVFRVTDTGSGIPREDLPHVFDRFWQASKTDRRGAGLGLPIVKGIVEAHGGHVWVESRVDAGTTFYFTIPTADVDTVMPAEAPAPSLA